MDLMSQVEMAQKKQRVLDEDILKAEDAGVEGLCWVVVFGVRMFAVDVAFGTDAVVVEWMRAEVFFAFATAAADKSAVVVHIFVALSVAVIVKMLEMTGE
jgi:hypothetical protein